MSHDWLFRQTDQFLAGYGNVRYNVIRPDYTETDDLPESVIKNLLVDVERTGSSEIQPSVSGPEYYLVRSAKAVLKIGDIIIPDVADTQIPPLTVIQDFGYGSLKAMRTSRKGQMFNQKRKILVEEVYFDFVTGGGSGKPLDPEVVGSLPYEQMKGVMFTRNHIMVGTRILDIVSNVRYRILSLMGTGVVTSFIMEQDKS